MGIAGAPEVHSADTGPHATFERDAAPILNRYCTGCHNPDEPNGELDLTSLAALRKGGEHGAVITPGSSASSRLLGVLTGKMEPAMPPEGEPRPTKEELGVLARWLDDGALGLEGEGANAASALSVPQLPPSRMPLPITALDLTPDGATLAVGRFQRVELRTLPTGDMVGTLEPLAGKVNDIRCSGDGQQVLVASGIEAVRGEASLWNVVTRQPVGTFGGHRDILYTADLSPDGKWVATAGYDRVVLIHDRTSGQVVHRLAEHNGPVFDLCFSADSQNLATCSADATVKIWRVTTGERLDTRSEPLKEQITTAIHPSGKWFVGAGSDSRIRMWRLLSTDQQAINPLIHLQFAHEGAVEKLRYSRDGQWLLSVGRDRTLKVWTAESLSEVAALPRQSAAVQVAAIDPMGRHVVVGRMDGTWEIYPLTLPSATQSPRAPQGPTAALSSAPLTTVSSTVDEREPNSHSQDAQPLALPAMVRGAIDREGDAADAADMFALDARAGERWILEVKAARQESLLDSYLEILDEASAPVPRVVLQAVQDSYFTFRTTSPTAVDSIRLHNWQDMRMHQFLYCNGEVVRLWHYPRGPDSGFSVFPGQGSRHTMFDTTAITHPMGETCYVVEPYTPGTPTPRNGLPAFTVYYANDDDSERELGADSRLTFDVPRDGRYYVRLRDARHFRGAAYRYELTIRPPAPTFAIESVATVNPELPLGGGVPLSVAINRTDGYDGAVQLELTNVPLGFHVAMPWTIEPGQLRATTLLWSDDQAKTPADDAPAMQLVATGQGHDHPIRLPPYDVGRPKLKDPSKLRVHARPVPSAGEDPATGWPILEMAPGSTATVALQVERRGHEGRVNFGGYQNPLNAPYGMYAGNVGLSGVIIPEQENERTVFIVADRVTAPGERLVFFATSDGGGATSSPILLRIRPTEAGGELSSSP